MMEFKVATAFGMRQSCPVGRQSQVSTETLAIAVLRRQTDTRLFLYADSILEG